SPPTSTSLSATTFRSITLLMIWVLGFAFGLRAGQAGRVQQQRGVSTHGIHVFKPAHIIRRHPGPAAAGPQATRIVFTPLLVPPAHQSCRCAFRQIPLIELTICQALT